ncbi:MAG: hypothetical protein PVG99_02775 [Desulfobacteraceae bacterium]|jgi:hypothetical protein
MDFKKHLEKAWHSTLKFIAPLILMTLVMTVVSAVTLGILGLVTLAGYIHSIILMLRDGREPRVQDLFSQMRLFFPLLGFGILVFLLSLIGFLLFYLPGIAVIFVVSFTCLYILPLMTDKGLGLIESVRESYSLAARGNLVDQLVVVIIFWGISAIGSSVFIGWLFTQPLATVFLVSVYEEKLQQSQRYPFTFDRERPPFSKNL